MANRNIKKPTIIRGNPQPGREPSCGFPFFSPLAFLFLSATKRFCTSSKKIQYFMSAVCYWKIFHTFAMSGSRHTYYWKCFRTVLSGKCGSFQSQKDSGRHSFIRLEYVAWGFLPVCSHIYTGVEYWVRLFLTRFFHNLLEDRRIAAPHFSF